MPTYTAGTATNCTLSFSKAGVNYTMRCYARKIGHGFSVISTESAGRQYRAFYPHQRAVDPFGVTLELKGYSQQRLVMDFLRNFIKAVVQTGSVSMTVRIPARDFLRQGVPVGGVIDTDQTGSNVFYPTIVFESISDPLDLGAPLMSSVDLASTGADDAGKFFYPASISTNDPNATANSFYDASPTPLPSRGDDPTPQPSPIGPNRPF